MVSPTIYDSDDLAAIRGQTRRFVDEQVLPRADRWEEQGVVPREVLRKM
ncbi:MAG: acyl-CoA dehydrogenase family protein, partial [Actinomycetota bacterium]